MQALQKFKVGIFSLSGLVALGLAAAPFAAASPSPVPLPQGKIDYVKNNKGKNSRLGDNWFLGAAVLSVNVSQDERGYAFNRDKGDTETPDSITLTQDSELFRVNGQAKLDTCTNSDTLPLKDKVVFVVGKNPQNNGKTLKGYAGKSTLTILKRGNKFFARVLLKANDTSLEENKYHINEDYEFEVSFTNGSWDALVRNGQVELQATAQGMVQYKQGVRAAINTIGTLSIALLEKLVNQWAALAIPVDLGDLRKHEFSAVPKISGTRAALSFVNSPFEADYWAPAVIKPQQGSSSSCDSVPNSDR